MYVPSFNYLSILECSSCFFFFVGGHRYIRREALFLPSSSLLCVCVCSATIASLSPSSFEAARDGAKSAVPLLSLPPPFFYEEKDVRESEKEEKEPPAREGGRERGTEKQAMQIASALLLPPTTLPPPPNSPLFRCRESAGRRRRREKPATSRKGSSSFPARRKGGRKRKKGEGGKEKPSFTASGRRKQKKKKENKWKGKHRSYSQRGWVGSDCVERVLSLLSLSPSLSSGSLSLPIPPPPKAHRIALPPRSRPPLECGRGERRVSERPPQRFPSFPPFIFHPLRDRFSLLVVLFLVYYSAQGTRRRRRRRRGRRVRVQQWCWWWNWECRRSVSGRGIFVSRVRSREERTTKRAEKNTEWEDRLPLASRKKRLFVSWYSRFKAASFFWRQKFFGCCHNFWESVVYVQKVVKKATACFFLPGTPSEEGRKRTPWLPRRDCRIMVRKGSGGRMLSRGQGWCCTEGNYGRSSLSSPFHPRDRCCCRPTVPATTTTDGSGFLGG